MCVPEYLHVCFTPIYPCQGPSTQGVEPLHSAEGYLYYNSNVINILVIPVVPKSNTSE